MPYKAVLIIGPDWPLTENIKKIYKAENCLIIGDGVRTITPDEITERLQDNVDSNTRIDISGHGITYDGEHGVELAPGQVLRTSSILSTVGQCTKAPTQVHLWSCFGGAAAKEASVLPKGSCLVAHAPEDSAAALSGLNRGLETGAAMHLSRPLPATPTLDYQHVLDDLSIGAGQKSFLSINIGKAKPIIVKDRLPDKMAERLENGMPQYPATIHAAVKGHYESAYNTITPALKEAQLDGVALASQPRREDLSAKEIQEFYNARFSYQLMMNPVGALTHATSNTSEMQKRANRDQSGLIAAQVDWSNPILVEALLANGFNPHATITAVTPSSPSYGMSILEHAARNGRARAAIMLLKHDANFKNLDVLYKTGVAREVLSWAHRNNRSDIVDNIVNALDKRQQYKMVKEELSSYDPHKEVIDALLLKLSTEQVNHLLKHAIDMEQGVGFLMPRAADFHQESVQSLVQDAMFDEDRKTLDALMPAVDKFATHQVQRLLDDAYRKRDTQRVYKLLPRINDFPTKQLQQLLTRAIENDNQKMIDGLMPRAANFTPKQLLQLSATTIEKNNKARLAGLMPHLQRAQMNVIEPLLHRAIIHNNGKVLSNLLPRTNELNSAQLNHLMQGALKYNNIKVVKHLLPRAAELEPNIHKQTMHRLADHAIERKDHKLMKACIEHASDLSTQQLRSVMAYAVNNDKVHTVKKLLLASTECNTERVTNQALYIAVAQGNEKTAKLLLKHPTNNRPKVLQEAMDLLPSSLRDSALHESMQRAQAALQPQQKKKSRSLVDRFRRSTAHKTTRPTADVSKGKRSHAKHSQHSR